MGFIKNLKDEMEQYNKYKNSSNEKALALPNHKRRNIFTYIQARNFGKKYADILGQKFGVMQDIENYAFLIDLFGRKNWEQALSNPEATTAQIAEKIFEANNIKSLDELQGNDLDIMKNHIRLNQTTGLELSDIDVGINPTNFRRRSLNKTMLDIFQEDGVDKNILKEIYEIYGTEIVSQYNMDLSLRNKSILALDENKSTIVELEDHVTDYFEEDFHNIFQKYFNDEELSKTEQCILIGLLAKESDLIGAYTVKHLKEHPDYIKSEIDTGVFEGIVVSGKNYTNEERKKIATLSKVWSAEDLKRYDNLGLLKERLCKFPQNQETMQILQKIDEVLEKPFSEVAKQSEEVAEFMDSAFMNYEVENRNRIVENIYNPEKKDEIIITDLSQMNSPAMLHFFEPGRTIYNFEDYVKGLEEKRSRELGKDFQFSKTEKDALLSQYKFKENHFITDSSIEMETIGQVSTYNNNYVTNISNQLSAMISSPENILKGNIRGRVAIGLSKETLNPELIATISNRNIHSNKGINYVESENEFEDFSASYDELTKQESKVGGNTEIVLFRNSYQASLKLSYVMYIGENELSSQMEKDDISSIKKQMEEVGLQVPLVIFDKYSMKEKMKNHEMPEQSEPDR